MKHLIFILCFFHYKCLSQNSNIFGFSTANTFTYCDINDTNFINKAVKLQPKLLRFPGGAVGNFYHFNKEGYGFDFEEIDTYHNGKFPKRARGLERSRNQNNHTQDYIEDFIYLAKKCNAKVILVANIFSKNDDILYMIEKIISNDLEVVGVELGSELSNRSYYQKGYTIDNYITSAQYYSKKIKENYPNLKIAVIAAPLGKKKGHRHNIWNEKLSRLDFYDAIIIHSYAKVIKGEAMDGQMIEEQREATNKVELFEIYKKRAINYLTVKYPLEIKSYQNIFNKPIWVTEWNLQMSKTTGNTFLQSLFVAHFVLELLTEKKFQSITLSTYHNLGGRDFSGSIFRQEKNNLFVQNTYTPLMMIGKLFNKNIYKTLKEIKDQLFIYKFYDNEDRLLCTYEIDWENYSFLFKPVSTKQNSEFYFKNDNLHDNSFINFSN